MTKFNLKALVRPNVAAMQPYSSARDEFKSIDADVVFLDANENPYDNGVNRYPDPQQRNLKSLIASQKGVSESNILVGNGSDEVLDLLFRSFCTPGKDSIISLPPTYGMYKVLSATNDIENRKVALTKDFQPDIPNIFKNITTPFPLSAKDLNLPLSKRNEDEGSTKMIFFCSPNNPTGNLIQSSKIIEVLEHFKGLVVIDEAYIDFAAAESWITQLENYPNLVVTQTLSKAYGMAGIRLGLVFASSEIIGILNKIKPPYNVNVLTQDRAYDRLSAVSQVNQEVNRILENRAELQRALLLISFVEEVFSSDANFVLCRVDDADRRYKELINQGIVVRNRSSQLLCTNTLRFTIGTPSENTQLINTLKSLQNG